MSKSLRIAAILLSLFTVSFARVSAQDSKLASEGLPELHIVMTDDGMQAPGEVDAGPTYVTLDNQSSNEAVIILATLPEGVTLEQVESESAQGSSEWLYKTTFAGGPDAAAGTKSAAVVNLTKGDWYIVNSQALSDEVPTSLKVSGSKKDAKSGDVKSDLKITFKDNKFDFPDELDAGQQVWEVKNDDDTLHFISLMWSPVEVSADEVLTLYGLTQASPESVDFSKMAQIQTAGNLGFVSKNQIFWVEVNLQPGYYVALDILTDEGSDTPHAAQGGIDTFHVPGDIVTPTPGS
jgi:hypothetical protein